MLTLDKLKAALDVAFDDPTQDITLQAIIDATVPMMERYIQNKITATDVTETLPGTSSRHIALTYYPIISLTSAGDVDAGNDITAYVTLEHDGKTGVVTYTDLFLPERHYTFTYRAGYETMPADIEYAQLLLAQHLYYQTDRVKGGVQSVVTPDGSYVYDNNAIPSQVRQILDRYRKFWL